MKVLVDTPKKTFVTFVIDASGSMMGVQDATISGFNEQLDTIRAMEGPDHEVFVTMYSFSNHDAIHRVLSRVKASEVKNLSKSSYICGGNTALLDAIGQAVSYTQDSPGLSDPNSAALMIIMTDGEENASREIRDRALIKNKVAELEATGKWTFTYMGVGNLDEISSGFGFAKGNITQFAHGIQGMASNIAVASAGLASYSMSRTAGETSVKNFYDNRAPIEKKESDDVLNHIKATVAVNKIQP